MVVCCLCQMFWWLWEWHCHQHYIQLYFQTVTILTPNFPKTLSIWEGMMHSHYERHNLVGVADLLSVHNRATALSVQPWSCSCPVSTTALPKYSTRYENPCTNGVLSLRGEIALEGSSTRTSSVVLSRPPNRLLRRGLFLTAWTASLTAFWTASMARK